MTIKYANFAVMGKPDVVSTTRLNNLGFRHRAKRHQASLEKEAFLLNVHLNTKLPSG